LANSIIHGGERAIAIATGSSSECATAASGGPSSEGTKSLRSSQFEFIDESDSSDDEEAASAFEFVCVSAWCLMVPRVLGGGSLGLSGGTSQFSARQLGMQHSVSGRRVLVNSTSISFLATFGCGMASTHITVDPFPLFGLCLQAKSVLAPRGYEISSACKVST
jgi:hypothetical protein